MHMPVLLLVPLAVLLVLALWLVLMPFSLWARYRSGRATQRAVPWLVRLNAILLALSVPIFMATAWFASRWLEGSLQHAAVGLLMGCLLGLISVALTRFEMSPVSGKLQYTPNRWLVLTLTLLVALRIVAGLWLSLRHLSSHLSQPGWLGPAGLLTVAGALLGYSLAYTWGLRSRLPRPSVGRC